MRDQAGRTFPSSDVDRIKLARAITGDTGVPGYPTTATDATYSGFFRPGGFLAAWVVFGLSMALLAGVGAISSEIGIAADMIGLVIVGVGTQIMSAIERVDRRVFYLIAEGRQFHRDRGAEYGAVMRSIASTGTAAEAVLAEWGQRVEDMYVACDAAEARRNVERADQLTNVSTSIHDLAETMAGELLAINGAMNGLRALLDVKPLPPLSNPFPDDAEMAEAE